MKKEVIIGFDIGTSNVKVAAVDLKNGKVVDAEKVGFSLIISKPGYSEIDSEGLWGCVQQAFKKLYDKTNDTCRYAGMGFSWFGDCMMLADENMEPLTNILQFSDRRAAGDTMKYYASKDPMAYGKEHNVPVPSMFVAPQSEALKCLWFKQNEPELFAKAKYLFDNQQFILAKLGLEPVIDDSLAGLKRLKRVEERTWSKELMDLFEIPYEMNKERIVSCTDVIGTVDHIGDIKLDEPIPVVPGAHDEVCGMMGLGVLPERKGLISTTLGTSDCATFFVDYTGKGFPKSGILPVRTKFGTYNVGGRGLPMSGASLEWYTRQFCPGESTGDALTRLFKAATFDGSNPNLMVPNFSKVQVGMKGLSFKTSTLDIFTALAEGICYELAINMTENSASMEEETGTPITKIIASGGGSITDEWLQLRSNVMNLPIQRSESTEACSIGAAVFAATGLGFYDSFMSASDSMVVLAETFEPDPAVHQAYAEKFEKYMEFRNYIVPPRNRH